MMRENCHNSLSSRYATDATAAHFALQSFFVYLLIVSVNGEYVHGKTIKKCLFAGIEVCVAFAWIHRRRFTWRMNQWNWFVFSSSILGSCFFASFFIRTYWNVSAVDYVKSHTHMLLCYGLSSGFGALKRTFESSDNIDLHTFFHSDEQKRARVRTRVRAREAEDREKHINMNEIEIRVNNCVRE